MNRLEDSVFAITKEDNLPTVIAQIRRMRNGDKSPVVLMLEDGVYHIEKTIELDERDSGLTICAAKDAHPVIDGSVFISGFQKYKGDISVTDVSHLPFCQEPFSAYSGIGIENDDAPVNDLYRDGKLLTVARFPSKGFFKVSEVSEDGSLTFKSEDLSASKYKDVDGLYATGYWKFLWADQTLAVKSDGNAWHLDGSKLESYYNEIKLEAPFFISNSLAFLSRKDEWVLDRTAGKLYVKGALGKEYVMPAVTGPLVHADSVENLSIIGLTFRYGRSNGVEANCCKNFVFARCTVEKFGNSGLVCLDAANAKIVQNRFRSFGFKAVYLSGGNRKNLKPSRSVFSDNDVTDTGHTRRTYSHGILIEGCGIEVLHNYFHDLPSSAIRIEGNDHLIAYNITERAVLESDDQGAIDIFGDPFYRGIKIMYNIWRDIGGKKELAGTCGKAGVRFDDNISGMYVYGNLFDNCSEGTFGALQVNGGRDNTIENNVFVRCRYVLSVTPGPIDSWRKTWIYYCRKNPFAFSEKWKQSYGDLTCLENYSQINRVYRNVIVGVETVLAPQSPAETLVENNYFFEKLAYHDLTKIAGFVPLPAESKLGPRHSLTF